MTTLKITVTSVLIILAALIAAWSHLAHQDGPGQAMPPCITEDSPGPCFWDASHRGNHQGVSFIVHANGEITYIAK